ncbi:hypothetical protein JB92DRAFT_3294570 [Gautieria morchelliformis]|nr:hypothetical protein JB92DRAFT_3294570 [Gautieria morchelliformis]
MLATKLLVEQDYQDTLDVQSPPGAGFSSPAAVRRPSEYGAVERFKASHLEGDPRRNSMPSRLRTASISSVDQALSDYSEVWPWNLTSQFDLGTPLSLLGSDDKKPVDSTSDRAVTCLVAVVHSPIAVAPSHKRRALQEIDLRQLPTRNGAPSKPNMGKTTALTTNNSPKTSTCARATAITEHADSSCTKGVTQGMTEKGREWKNQIVKLQLARERHAKEAQAKEVAHVKLQTQRKAIETMVAAGLSTEEIQEYLDDPDADASDSDDGGESTVYAPGHLFELSLANLAAAVWSRSEFTNYEPSPYHPG